MAVMNGPTSASIKIKDKALFRNIDCMTLGMEKTIDKGKSLASLSFCFILSSVCLDFLQRETFKCFLQGIS